IIGVDAAVKLNDGLVDHPGTMVAALLPHLIGSFFGLILLSIACWRSGVFPRIALAALVAFCRSNGIELIDCQQHTRHLASFGAREVPRAAFEGHLANALDEPTPKRWTYDRAMWTQLGLLPRSAPETTLAP
ncbi:MAG TPA: hypothetical protein VFZ61_14885, partial [Polyangiales bacterium]